MRVLLLAVLLVCVTQMVLVEALFGLAGLVALKAGAVGYALGRGSRGGYGYGRRGYGHGRRYGGYGHGYGGYGHRRYGRDVSAQEEPDVAEQEQELGVEAAQLDAYFAAVAIGDDDQCGLKLVCQLHVSESDQLQLGEDAAMIRALFGSDVPSSGLEESPKRPYDAAALLGRSAVSVTTCAEAFPRCSQDAPQMLQAIQ